MPHMIGDVVPLVTQPMIDHLTVNSHKQSSDVLLAKR
jgi:hypothetical protein